MLIAYNHDHNGKVNPVFVVMSAPFKRDQEQRSRTMTRNTTSNPRSSALPRFCGLIAMLATETYSFSLNGGVPRGWQMEEPSL
jgi:hypothetical protein